MILIVITFVQVAIAVVVIINKVRFQAHRMCRLVPALCALPFIIRTRTCTLTRPNPPYRCS